MKESDFETKIANAKAILDKLMDPEITLENSIVSYEAGMKELKAAQKMLEEAQLQIQTIKNTHEDQES